MVYFTRHTIKMDGHNCFDKAELLPVVACLKNQNLTFPGKLFTQFIMKSSRLHWPNG